MYYQITETQKTAIEQHLPNGVDLVETKNGKFYINSDLVPKIQQDHGALLELIAQIEFSSDWATFVATLTQYDFGTIEEAASAGFATYREMIARINGAGGLSGDPTKLDTDIAIYIGYTGNISNMVVSMTMIRNMMKDGFFEWALRSSVHYKDTRATGITQAIEDENSSAIRAVAKKFGRDDATLDYAELSPKGTLV